MKKTRYEELKIAEGPDLYKDLATKLIPYRKEPAGSRIFIVEGTAKNPRIGIRYPGRKLRSRKGDLKKPNARSALWANLLDFEVIPFEKGKPQESTFFTYANLLEDYDIHKKGSKKFWNMVVRLYEDNAVTANPPKLSGIPPVRFLEMLKWMWVQEDVNYRLSWEDVGSSIRYRLENRTGTPTSKGAGRAKFFGALVLVRDPHFTARVVKKIVPTY